MQFVSKKLGCWEKNRKVSGTKKRQLQKSFVFNYIYLQRVANMQKTCVCKLWNNVPPLNIAKISNISLSAKDNIVKSFRESAEISACKEQGQNSVLDACDVQALS